MQSREGSRVSSVDKTLIEATSSSFQQTAIDRAGQGFQHGIFTAQPFSLDILPVCDYYQGRTY